MGLPIEAAGAVMLGTGWGVVAWVVGLPVVGAVGCAAGAV